MPPRCPCGRACGTTRRTRMRSMCCSTPRGDFVALALSSPDGNALFEVPRSVLVRFLRRTYMAVPRSRETEYLDIDAAVTRLLTRAGPTTRAGLPTPAGPATPAPPRAAGRAAGVPPPAEPSRRRERCA